MGDGDLRSQFEEEARGVGVSQAVRFLGYRHDVPDLLHAADLFVMPSHLEGLCSTLIDAMFAEVPIVATTAGGIPEVLDGVPGEPPVAMLVPPRQPEPLANAIIKALSDLPALKEMSGARKRERNRTSLPSAWSKTHWQSIAKCSRANVRCATSV